MMTGQQFLGRKLTARLAAREWPKRTNGNLHLPHGSVAQHNHEMVAAAATFGRFFGMEPASVDESSQGFGI